MKNFLLVLLALPFFSNAQTGYLYGLYLGTSTALNSNTGVATIQPGVAVVSYLSAFPNTKIYEFCDHVVYALHHRFFQVTGDSVNMYLLNFDLDQGSLTNILFKVDSVGDGTPG